MTKQEYADYEAAVAHFFELEGIDNLSSCYDNDDNLIYDEFSWHECECCGSRLGGPRYQASAYHRASGEILTYDICAGCLYYAEYGQVDDMTMMDIEED